MSAVNVLKIIPKNTICKFEDSFCFEIIFEVLSELKNELEWKMIYIGNAEDSSYDQILETIEIDGPLNIGTMKFDFTGDAPDIRKIPESEILGVTAVLLCCSYNNQEFFRCGYYLNNIYDSEEMNNNPPEKIDINHVVRSILADKPRITKFDIDWDNSIKNEGVINRINESNKGSSMIEEKMSEGEKLDSFIKDTTNEGSMLEEMNK